MTEAKTRSAPPVAGPALMAWVPLRLTDVVGAGLLVLTGIVATAAVMAKVDPTRVLLLLLIAPLAEEAIFRAGLQDALLRRGQRSWASNLTTALAFALAHVIVRADLAAVLMLLPALLIGGVYAQGRRLRACVLLHAAMNAAWLAWTLRA